MKNLNMLVAEELNCFATISVQLFGPGPACARDTVRGHIVIATISSRPMLGKCWDVQSFHFTRIIRGPEKGSDSLKVT